MGKGALMDQRELARLYVRASNYAARMSEILAELGHMPSTHPDAAALIERYEEMAHVFDAVMAQLVLQVPGLGVLQRDRQETPKEIGMWNPDSPVPDAFRKEQTHSTAQRFLQRVLGRK